MRLTFKILIVLFILAVTVSANVNAPTSWGRGYKLFNVNGSYWDLMNENGIQNGSLANLTNISMKTPDAVNATANITFNGTSVSYSSNITAAGEVYQFTNGTLGNRKVNINTSQNASWSCSKFVTEVNVNSSNFTASTCSSNRTTLTSTTMGTSSNSYTVVTNSSNITVQAAFTGGFNYSSSYVDASGSSYSNAGDQDVIYRSTDTTGTLGEIFRINVNTSPGSRIVFTEITIPTVRPSTPINGSAVLNLTSNTIDVYSNGAWHNYNGTVV